MCVHVHGLAMAIRAHPCEQRSTLHKTALTVAKRYVNELMVAHFRLWLAAVVYVQDRVTS